ncbi:MAG: hypothetical protein RCG16_00140 [Rickettsia hoogstraalii]
MHMAQKEQAHKHAIDLKNLKIQERVAKLTRICLLIFGICLVVSIF